MRSKGKIYSDAYHFDSIFGSLVNPYCIKDTGHYITPWCQIFRLRLTQSNSRDIFFLILMANELAPQGNVVPVFIVTEKKHFTSYHFLVIKLDLIVQDCSISFNSDKRKLVDLIDEY